VLLLPTKSRICQAATSTNKLAAATNSAALPSPRYRCQHLQCHALGKLPPLLPSWPSPPRCCCASTTAAIAVAFVSIVIIVVVIVVVSDSVDAAAFA
jgi:hypothetical protein